MTAHFLGACLTGRDGAWSLENTTTGARLASRLVAAGDRASRNRGLLGRTSLPRHEALVLVPCSGVHTWFMRFAIDIAFVARDGTVLKVRRAVGPWRLSARPGAFAVIEMAAGAMARLQAGHRLAAVRDDAADA